MEDTNTSTIPASLSESLQAMPNANLDAVRPQVLALVQQWLNAKRAENKQRFEEHGHADRLVRALSAMMDEVIRALFRLLMPNDHGVSVVATGGYGRAEMFPYSDVDLLILYRPSARIAAERMARFMLYILWDSGLKVGHALRSLDDALTLAQEDITIRTNLLDARQIVGDGELFENLRSRLRAEIIEPSVQEFIEAKLGERDARHQRFGDSRYLLEPNLKEGKGGLRDLQTLYWLARYAYPVDDLGELVRLKLLSQEEYDAYLKAQAFLWELRAHLHYACGKPEERLTFDRQQLIAPRMGYRDHAGAVAVERLMKHYFLTANSVGALTRIVCALLEEAHKRKPRQPLAWRLQALWKLDGFTLDGERLATKHENEFANDPMRMLKLFFVAQKHGFDIHPRTLQQVTRNLSKVDRAFQDDAKANALFLDILLSPKGPEQTLRRMNEVGLLGRFIPEFGRVVGQMQFNMYHIYTVDEHIIVALGILHGIASGKFANELPLATDVMKRVKSKRALYFSVLCHDLGKGRGGDQCEQGAAIVTKLSKRFAFSADEQELSAWLVGNHLLFTDMAFKRDASDPQTVRDFAEKVHTAEKLRCLLLVTVPDIRAVGPGVWNGWKATLLRELFARTEELMTTGQLKLREQELSALQAQLEERLPTWGRDDINAYLALGTPEYVASLDAAAHARIARQQREIVQQKLPVTMEPAHDTQRGYTDLTIVTPDRPALFSKLAGVIALSGANIVSAKIFTLKNGMAVDVFQVQDQEGKPFDKSDRLARMAVRLQQVLTDQLDLAKELSKQKPAVGSRKDAFQMAGQVFIENDVSAQYTVVEVTGRDRVGFLYAVTKALSEQALTIASAHISTYGAQAVDVFYVKDAFGFKVTHEAKLLALREALLAAVNP